MRKLIWLLLTAALLYSGYWLIGARASERGLAIWLEQRAQEGWQSDYAELSTTGYPLAFTSTLTDLALADPQTGTAYETPQFTIESKSYAPTQFTAIFDQQARVATPYQTIDLTHDIMTGTIDVGVGASLPLVSSAFTLQALGAQSSLGWGVTLENAHVTSQRHEGDTLTHDVSLLGENLKPTGLTSVIKDPDGLLADQFDLLSAQATISFDKEWDLSALEGPRPQPTAVKLTDITAKWGQLDLRLAGAFDVDANGYPNGKVQIKAQNWREMIALAISAGVIPRNMESLLVKGGELISSLKGNSETLDADLTLRGGAISLGFIPLGPAPRLIIR